MNRAIDWSRARALRQEVGEGAESSPPPRPRRDAYSDDVVAALARLPAEQRAVVVMRHLLEYTPGEIAARSGCRAGPSTPGCVAAWTG